MQLSMNGQDWAFTEGAWSQGADGVIAAPGNLGDRNIALNTITAYADFEAEFEFVWDTPWTNAAFLFRATDARHHYMVHFPVVGQHYRAEHFWTMVSKVDSDGYIKVLKMELIHGVTSMPTLWHQVKVTAVGNEIRVWVDGRPMSPVVDDTYSQPGYVGLSTYNSIGSGARSRFRNLSIKGTPVAAPPFDPAPQPQRNWFQVTDVGGSGCSNIVRAANGELLVMVANKLLRSQDNGRTWAVSAAAAPGQLLHQVKDGPLEAYQLSHEVPFKLSKATSADHGATWSEPQEVGDVMFPENLPWNKLYASRLLETQQGSLLLVAYAVTDGQPQTINGRWYNQRPVPWSAGYCIRSTDGGESWSAPVNIDGPPHHDSQWMVPKEGSETSLAQTKDGKIMALVRPFASPLMWESWSFDDGANWQPLTRGPFPMYACNNSMISTQSGALIIGGRFPGIGVQVSRDGGMTWQGAGIDSAGWANGAMFEVEPNVVLYIYGGKINPETMRGQLIRITAADIEPIR